MQHTSFLSLQIYMSHLPRAQKNYKILSMKYCIKCGNQILKTKKRYCPYCHTDLANPNNVVERDIDIAVQKVNEESKIENGDVYKQNDADILDYELTEDEIRQSTLKPHKKIVAFFLQLFLGCFGAAFFYMGRYVRGILWIIFCALFCLLYFIMYYYVFVVLVITNIVMSLFMLFGKQTDKNGIELQ